MIGPDNNDYDYDFSDDEAWPTIDLIPRQRQPEESRIEL